MKLRYENIWIRNAVFFTLFSALIALDMILADDQDKIEVKKEFIALFLIYIFIFCHNYFLLRSFLLKKKIKKYLAFSFLYTLTGSFILHFSAVLWGDKEDSLAFFSDFFALIMLLIFGSGLYILSLWINDNLIVSKKRALATETELATLKLQMNPHFLLNALNNLYGVALSSPQSVPDKILELSDLLTYQIEASQKEWISLQEEMKFAEKFLSYMEWKTKGMEVEMHMQGEIRNYRISPMIFLPLLENAVKYSAEMSSPKVVISWMFHEKKLEITIINNYNPLSRGLTSTKTGIENLQRRLELYHPEHTLTLSKNDHTFAVNLILWNLSYAA